MKYFLINCWMFLFLSLQAQVNYTYISDRQFQDPSDLMGYDFRPAYLEVPDGREEKLTPGSYSFGVTQNNLYVEGEGIRGVYTLNNIKPTEYGYILLLMNARDPMIQGHLKLILNPKAQVEALVFRRSKNDKEIIFFQEQIPANMNQREQAFFTDNQELVVENTDSIWGTVIYPFYQVHLNGNIQERLQAADSTSISFVEEITVVEKVKKKGKEKAKVEAEAKAEEEAGTEEEILAVGVVQEEVDSLVEKKVKITKEYFVNVRSILKYDDGTMEDKTWVYPVKKLVEREDTAAGQGEDRYQIEITLKKGDSLYLYLSPERAINWMEVRDKHYKMRGI